MFSVLRNITNPIFFITNDVSRGLGLEKLLPNYHIICLDDHPLVDYLLEEKINVFCLERELGGKNIFFRNSGKVLEHPLTEEYITQKANGEVPWILFFKPSAKIDALCQKRGYQKIGNDTKTNRLFEDKIIFYQTCQRLGLPVPLGEIVDLQLIDFDVFEKKYGGNLVVQFGRGWAGSTTFFIKDEKELEVLKKKMGSRAVKVTQFIKGPTILNNCCVARDKIWVTPPARQINAIADFTAKKGGTCGRVWPAKIDKKQLDEIETMSRVVGEEMRGNDYRGWFGLDFLLEEKTNKIYLSENNARLTASTPFFTKLEIGAGKRPLLMNHILEFLDKGRKIAVQPNCPAVQLSSCLTVQLSGGELIVRNNSEKPIVIKKDFRPGIYQLNGEKFEFMKKAYFEFMKKAYFKFMKKAYDVEGVENENEFFLTVAAKNRIVNPETEMIRLDAPEDILNTINQPHQSLIKALLELKKDLL